jgi:N-acetylglucosaminyldiphosphoundecaprenol N-acetyl-beta-D-mannosaminyltransferase
MAAYLGRIEATAMIGVGAAFDFHSGMAKLAPAWVRRLGMEWAYRLACEPRRMWRRNLDSPRFLLAVLRQRLGRAIGNRGKAR